MAIAYFDSSAFVEADPHALSGADAVHLASMLALDLGDTVFVAWDVRLRSGAQAAGAQLVPAG